MSIQFIVKEKQYAGTYRNPYKRGGGGMKWGPWKTRSMHASLREALDAATVTVGLAKRSVFYGGERISDGPKLLHSFTVPFGVDPVSAEEQRLVAERKSL